MKISKSDLNYAGECFLKDINIERRLNPKVNSHKEINRLTKIFSNYARLNSIVYTAFDGDHFHVLQNMRKYVLSQDFIPANPESILGYKNVVTEHLNKRGVLVDDLSILKHCDELWIFTDCDVEWKKAINLPEGVLIELAYFLKRKSKSKVKFIPLTPLLRGEKKSCNRFTPSFDFIEKDLKSTPKSKVLEMANNNYMIDSELRKLRFFITDPLDYKYSEWLRDRRLDRREISLVPGLATRVSDADNNMINTGKIILSWASFVRFSNFAYILPSFDSHRNPSIIRESLKNYFIQYKSKHDLQVKDWEIFNIPKKLQKDKWPITEFEANINRN